MKTLREIAKLAAFVIAVHIALQTLPAQSWYILTAVALLWLFSLSKQVDKALKIPHVTSARTASVSLEIPPPLRVKSTFSLRLDLDEISKRLALTLEEESGRTSTTVPAPDELGCRTVNPRRTWIGLCVALLWTGVSVSVWPVASAAQDVERGFVDLYVGITKPLESDVPTWKFADDTRAVGGARFGVWLGQNLGVSLRSWYLQMDAKEQDGLSPSDLAFLGVSLELLGRWPLADRWALYGSLGPALAVTTLDRQIDPATGKEDDARSVAPGASGAVGIEFRILKRLRAFGEFQGSLVYPSFEFRDQTITPRLIHLNGLAGIRLAF